MSASRWYVGERYSHHAICVRERETRDLIAEVFARGSDESSAQLIASAPDLLAERDELRAVLREILEEECIPPGFSLLIERAQKLVYGNSLSEAK